jgi:hypothetical protein
LTSPVTHFEIYAEKPPQLAEFYQSLLGWRIEQAPGIDYWRIQSGANTAGGINGGLTYRPFPGPRSWVRFVVDFIMFVVLMPFFALKELGRAIGDDNLYDLFFVRRGGYMPPQS